VADLIPELSRRIAERIADQVQDARLNGGELADGVDRIRQAPQAVADRDARVGDAAVLQLGEHLQPKLRKSIVSFVASSGSDCKTKPAYTS
jgi:hypothetical protein